MAQLPSRAALAALTELVQNISPVAALGFVRTLGSREIVLCVDAYGLREYSVDRQELPDALRDFQAETISLELESPEGGARGAVDWQWRFDGARRIASLPVAASEDESYRRFWVAFSSSDPLRSDQLSALESIAAKTPTLWQQETTAAADAEQVRRLECTAAWLPALRRVLDIRGIFEQLSSISQQALPHNFLSLGLYDEDLTTLSVYALTGQGQPVARSFPNPYPRSVVRAWTFDIIDDRRSYPLEQDRPPVQSGAAASLRFSLELEGRVLGGLAFMSFAPAAYSTADVAIGRRIADYVAIALSHQRLAEQLAEQARRSEALRARAEQLQHLDDALASLLSAGELSEVFNRVSQVAQRAIAHDAVVVAVPVPDSHRAQVRAAARVGPDPFPDVIEMPPLLGGADWEFDIVDDLHASPVQRQQWLAQQGYRGALRVPLRLDSELVGTISFLASAPGQYASADVAVARRIADKVALRLAHERGAVLRKQAGEATARAAQLEARVRALVDELDARTGYRRVVGNSREWRHVLTQATQVAATETTVLLLGESGTGKEVIARFLHRASARDGGPFVALNCAALPEHLLEAELFGYERGAFTGATQSKPGQLEQAAGGTLFLDEVGEMSLPAQAKFLRVLQEREFQRLGGTRVLRADARIVAATNRDLPRAIVNGQFREDLFYRLNVFAIRLPALRERRQDVLPLSDAFLKEIGRGLGRPPGGISHDARSMLMDYHWPGNVRELRNVLERAAILCDGGLITPDHLGIATHAAGPAPGGNAVAPPSAAPAQPSNPTDLLSMERDMIAQALQSARYNKSKASRALGLTRQQLYLRMRKHGIE